MTEHEIIRQLAQKMTDDMMTALCGVNAFKMPTPTALRLTPSGSFEVMELRDDGSIIEPLRCNCGGMIVFHRPTCPFYCMVT